MGLATQYRTSLPIGTGMEMTVVSEAPVSDIFPHSALFFAQFLPALGKINNVEFLPEGLT
jgi:hypothetical protein